jgi:hypothetical protein
MAAAPTRHRVVPSASALLPVSMVITFAAFLATSWAERPWLIGAFVGEALAWTWSRSSARFVVVDDDGYAFEAGGREKLRVRWSDVKKVRHEPREQAVYVDCGDPARNLLVPPRRGFGFHVSDAATLCARVLASVPAEKVETVERLEKPPEA